MALSRGYGSKNWWANLLLFLLAGLLSAAAVPSSDLQTRQSVPRTETVAKQKPAWRWSVDERLAARFDPEAMKARAAERAAEQEAYRKRLSPKVAHDPLFRTQESGESGMTEIEGRKNPELLLPFELFDNLLNTGFPPEGLEDRQLVQSDGRSIIDERAIALGFGRDFWKRLERAAAPYLALQRELERRALSHEPAHTEEPKGPFGMNGQAIDFCRSRFEALATAKAEFGEDNFVHLLYVGVAPTFSVSSPVAEGSSERLRYWEGGCK